MGYSRCGIFQGWQNIQAPESSNQQIQTDLTLEQYKLDFKLFQSSEMDETWGIERYYWNFKIWVKGTLKLHMRYNTDHTFRGLVDVSKSEILTINRRPVFEWFNGVKMPTPREKSPVNT